MKKKVLITILGILLFCAGTTLADTVELDLFTLGCPTEFAFNSPQFGWEKDFDLGVTFTEISHIYIDWSGGITGGLAVDDYGAPGEPFPLDVGIIASMSYPRLSEIWGGETTYPEPEPFDCLSEIPPGTSAWADLLDGEGTIIIDYTEFVFGGNGGYIEHGSVTLDRATLVVDGVVVPEPASILLFMMGSLYLRVKHQTS